MAVTKKGGEATPGGHKPSWMKMGDAAKAAIAKDEKKAEEKEAQIGKMRRFYLPSGKGSQITFLDGKLDEDGCLMAPMFDEHQVFKDGHWRNWFICTKDEEPCPICDTGANESRLVAMFTVIDHSEYTAGNGVTYKDQRKLFVCKRSTYNQLQKKAAKHGGLAGCTFDVERTGDKEPSCGNDFDFVQKRGKSELVKAYPKTEIAPANYEEEIVYYTAAELREMGFGGKVVGKEQPPAGDDYSDEL